MSPRTQMIMIGLLAFTLGCRGAEPPQRSDGGDRDLGLRWEQIDQEVLLTSRSPEALYLVVRSDASGDQTQVTFERGELRIAEGMVYELKPKPLLSCPPGSLCQECMPNSSQPDCVWPPAPPSPGGFVVWERPPPPGLDVQLQR